MTKALLILSSMLMTSCYNLNVVEIKGGSTTTTIYHQQSTDDPVIVKDDVKPTPVITRCIATSVPMPVRPIPPLRELELLGDDDNESLDRLIRTYTVTLNNHISLLEERLRKANDEIKKCR